MIKFSKVSFRYASSKPYVLEDINMSLESNHIYGLLGKNGVGKSTIFRMISGLNPVTQGEVLTHGCVPFERKPSMLQDIFLLPEEMEFPAITPLQYAKLYGSFYPNFLETEMLEHLKQFDIDANQKLTSMSYGQRKKSYIAFALACHTRVLLMDEPTNGLDIPSKTIFRKMLAACTKDDRLNRIIIISTHQVRDLERLIDAVIIVEDRHIALCETADTLLKAFHFGSFEEGAQVVYRDETERGLIGLTMRGDAPIQGIEDLDLEILFNAVSVCGEAVQNRLLGC